MSKNVPIVIEIVRRMKEGSTEPFLCRCDDGKLYVVKSKPRMPPRELVVEFVAANLASGVGLSIPDFCIVDIPAELIEYSPELYGEISDGYAFASRFIESAAELSFRQAHNQNIVPLRDQKMIYLFDRWILNADRTLTEKGGNVNMLYDVANDKYYLIDHNLSFDHSEPADDFRLHVYSPLNRVWLFDMVDKEACEQVLRDAMANYSSFTQAIPDDWIGDVKLIAFMQSTLERAATEEFWSTIL